MKIKPLSSAKRPPTNARAAAFLCLCDVERGRYPEDAIDHFSDKLSVKDRALTSAIVYGVTRWKLKLEWVLKHFLARPDKPLDDRVRLILLTGAFQMLFMDRIPVSAAVNESVLLARHMGPPWSPKFVNAVLRNLARAENPPDPASTALSEIEKLSLLTSHPEWIVNRLLNRFEYEQVEALLDADNHQAPLTIRILHNRTTRDELAGMLESRLDRVEKTVYSPFGLNLYGSTGPVTDLPGFNDGLFAVQDEAAQLAGLLARPGKRETVLDACAGVGGKTMHLAEYTDNPVFAADIDLSRLRRIENESRRLALPEPIVIRADFTSSSTFSESSFDTVLVDAPCSSLGVIRRRPDVKWLKTEHTPGKMAGRQKVLINKLSRLVKPGGRLVYAVCTWSEEETSGVIQWFLEKHSEFKVVPISSILPESCRDLETSAGMLQTWPHKHGTDGFFAAALVKDRECK